MKPIVCPIMRSGTLVKELYRDPAEAQCLMKECAWWLTELSVVLSNRLHVVLSSADESNCNLKQS